MMDEYDGVKPFGVCDYIREVNYWTGDAIFIDAEAFGAHGAAVGKHGEPGWQGELKNCKILIIKFYLKFDM